VLLTTALLANTIEARGETPPDALQLMLKAKFREDGKTKRATVKLEIMAKGATKRVRSLHFFKKELDDHIRYTTYFIAPPEVRNSSFMIWDKIDSRTDDRWLYLPAIRQVRRLAPGDARKSFFNSDFVYEDITLRDPEHDSHVLLGRGKYKEWDCWVIESKPLSPGSVDFASYKTWIWRDQNIMVALKYYDEKGELVRQGEATKLSQIQGIWDYEVMTVINQRTGSKSRVTYGNVKYDIDIPDEYFSEQQLSRGPPS
jgi:hypothetical protein